MGFLQSIGLLPSPGTLAPRHVASPWTDSQLQTIVWSEIVGTDVPLPVSRAEAMSVPAVAKARNLLATTVARLPLVVMDANGPLPAAQQPTWCYRTNANVHPYQRTMWTVDDLLFYGCSLWYVVRGSEGDILSADRVDWASWSVDSAGAIYVNGVAVQARDVIYFPGHVEGLLDNGRTAIRTARSIERSVERRASTPVPVMEIHQANDNETLTKAQAQAYVDAYNKARRDPEGATVFTPNHIELLPHGDKADSGALVEARNASRLDIANLTGVPASLLEGSPAEASLTYVTTEGKRSEFLEYGVQPWVETIATRLSMDDVVPRGQRVRLDESEQLATLPSATGAETQD